MDALRRDFRQNWERIKPQRMLEHPGVSPFKLEHEEWQRFKDENRNPS